MKLKDKLSQGTVKQYCIMVRDMALSAGWNPSRAVWPWTGYITSLGLGFLICEMGEITLLQRVIVSFKWILHVEHLEQSLAGSKQSVLAVTEMFGQLGDIIIFVF